MVDIFAKEVFIMVGYPGSGKSTLGRKIADIWGIKYLSTDVIRQEIFNSPHFDPVGGDKLVKSITNRVYEALYERALDFYQKNKKVIIDGTHLHTKKREKTLRILLTKVKAEKICFIMVKTPPKVIDERMSTKTELNNTNETIYDAWKRVHGYFVRDKKEGLISWPSKNGEIEVVSSDEVCLTLDKFSASDFLSAPLAKPDIFPHTKTV